MGLYDPWVTLRMKRSLWEQIEDDICNLWECELDDTEVGRTIMITEEGVREDWDAELAGKVKKSDG